MNTCAANPLLSLELTVDYPQRPGVLNNLRLDLEPGEIVGLIGESGSGKSTLALAILGLLRQKQAGLRGKLLFNGQDLLTMNERQMRTLRGREIGLVLQSPASSLNPALCIRRQLEETWRAHANGTSADCKQAIREVTESVSLPSDRDFLDRLPSQISVGQAQRVLIAMAILHRPRLLIADEPTSALDILTQAEIMDLVCRLSRERGISVLYISHDLLSVTALCDKLAILHTGHIVEYGTVQELLQNPRHTCTRNLLSALQKPVQRLSDAALTGVHCAGNRSPATPTLGPQITHSERGFTTGALL